MTPMKAGALIFLLVAGASIAGLALGVFTNSTEEQDVAAPQTDMIEQKTATPPIDASVAAPEAATASMDTSASAPETAIPPEQASEPVQVETATFALG